MSVMQILELSKSVSLGIVAVRLTSRTGHNTHWLEPNSSASAKITNIDDDVYFKNY